MNTFNYLRPAFLFLSLMLFYQCSKEPSSPSEVSVAQNELPENFVNDTWWNDAVFYEIFVRSFYDSDGDGIGDIQGIIEKLDYLNDGNPNTSSDLGVTALWLMPIFPSPSYHGYDVTDYRDIHPDYGSMDDFRALVNAAHSRGIKVIIDFVGNHTSDQHPWFTSSANNNDKRDWYIWRSSAPDYNGPWGQTVWHERNNAYYYGIFWGGMPDLNYNNQEVTNEIKNTVRFWKEDIGVDGFRIDAVKHWIENGSNQENTAQTLSWWRDFYVFQKSIDAGLMTVGEAWTSTQNIAPYADNRLDYCFEFDLANAILDGVINQSGAGITNKMNEILSTYPEGQYGTFLTNHDQDRSFNRLRQSPARAKLAASILLSLPGVPYLYYGEEVGMLGQKPDENIRRPMQWSSEANAGFSSQTPWHPINTNFADANVADQSQDQNSLWRHYQKWISTRNNTAALRKGTYTAVNAGSTTVFAFLRVLDNQTPVLALHNLSTQNREELNLSATQSDLDPGSYSLRSLEDDTELGTLTVESNGSFSINLTELDLQGQHSLLISLHSS